MWVCACSTYLVDSYSSFTNSLFTMTGAGIKDQKFGRAQTICQCYWLWRVIGMQIVHTEHIITKLYLCCYRTMPSWLHINFHYVVDAVATFAFKTEVDVRESNSSRCDGRSRFSLTFFPNNHPLKYDNS